MSIIFAQKNVQTKERVSICMVIVSEHTMAVEQLSATISPYPTSKIAVATKEGIS